MPEQSIKALPLQGKRILVTRTHEQAAAFSERLKALGAIPIEFPVIRIVPPQNWETLDAALEKLFLVDTAPEEGHPQGDAPTIHVSACEEAACIVGASPCGCPGAEIDSVHSTLTSVPMQERPYYTWLVFTSANGVNICCERLRSLGHDLQAMHLVRVATIGPATAAALTCYGISADLIPDEYIAEGVAAALIRDAQQRGESLKGKRILLPRAAEARKILVTELQQVGAEVDEVAAYYTHPVDGDNEQGREVLHLLQHNNIDVITFTSSSTVRNFVQWLTSYEGPGTRFIARNPQLKIACIGPITSQTARKLGLDVHIEARTFTIDGLVEAIIQSEENRV